MFSFNNIYEYKKKPFSQVKQFQIFPLSEKGVDKYMSNDSYNHHFLGKVNPLMLKQLEEEEKARLIKYGINENESKEETNEENKGMKLEDIDANANVNSNKENKNENLQQPDGDGDVRHNGDCYTEGNIKQKKIVKKKIKIGKSQR